MKRHPRISITNNNKKVVSRVRRNLFPEENGSNFCVI